MNYCQNYGPCSVEIVNIWILCAIKYRIFSEQKHNHQIHEYQYFDDCIFFKLLYCIALKFLYYEVANIKPVG